MRDVTEKGKGQLVATGKLTAVGGAALAVIVMQVVAFGVFMDLITSIVLVGVGYGARMWTERK